jgi:hypothetical protein
MKEQRSAQAAAVPSAMSPQLAGCYAVTMTTVTALVVSVRDDGFKVLLQAIARILRGSMPMLNYLLSPEGQTIPALVRDCFYTSVTGAAAYAGAVVAAHSTPGLFPGTAEIISTQVWMRWVAAYVGEALPAQQAVDLAGDDFHRCHPPPRGTTEPPIRRPARPP